MGRRIYSLLINEMVRVDTILEKGLKPQHNSQVGCGDPGWGKEGGKVDHVHFNTSIAKSYYVLEKTALSRRPGLRHRDSRTIREYVSALKKAFPSLKQSLCDGQPANTCCSAVQSHVIRACSSDLIGLCCIPRASSEYINTYERAVFGSHKCTYDGQSIVARMRLAHRILASACIVLTCTLAPLSLAVVSSCRRVSRVC
jgi:hypothetical protein